MSRLLRAAYEFDAVGRARGLYVEKLYCGCLRGGSSLIHDCRRSWTRFILAQFTNRQPVPHRYNLGVTAPVFNLICTVSLLILVSFPLVYSFVAANWFVNNTCGIWKLLETTSLVIIVILLQLVVHHIHCLRLVLSNQLSGTVDRIFNALLERRIRRYTATELNDQ